MTAVKEMAEVKEMTGVKEMAEVKEMTGAKKMAEVTDERLIEAAVKMLASAYAPYSRFHVGAALLGKSGKVYTGCNIENTSYGASVCAERTAFFKAVSEGEKEFVSIAIAGGRDGVPGGPCQPCGICRQVMSEFCDPETFRIILPSSGGETSVFLLKDLLPESFTL